jgi:hypothetical protein
MPVPVPVLLAPLPLLVVKRGPPPVPLAIPEPVAPALCPPPEAPVVNWDEFVPFPPPHEATATTIAVTYAIKAQKYRMRGCYAARTRDYKCSIVVPRDREKTKDYTIARFIWVASDPSNSAGAAGDPLTSRCARRAA